MRFRRLFSFVLLLMVVNNHIPSASAAVKTDTKTETKAEAKTETKTKTPDKPVVDKKTFRASSIEKYFIGSSLAQGEEALAAQLKRKKKDDQLRFGLGMVQFIRAIEGLGQDLRRYGLRDHSALNVPFLRMPVGPNPNPEILSYEKARKIFETVHDRLRQSEETLAAITDEKVKLSLHFGLIRLDLNSDGKAEDSEALWKLYADISHNYEMQLANAEQFSITFDRGDVSWLRGYCHLLQSLCQIYLAHDTKEFFDCTAHLFFAKVDSPYPFLESGRRVRSLRNSDVDILDLIALIHLIRWNVVEPERMASALHHLEGMVGQSKESWKYIMAETDDDREWIPNPKQTGVLPNMRVTDEMVVAWNALMDEADKLLSGKLLISFWRGDDGRGVNLRRVFLEPTKLDLVLWVQGPAAAPYLEKGPTTKMETWRQIQRAFGGQFPGFAIWFN